MAVAKGPASFLFSAGSGTVGETVAPQPRRLLSLDVLRGSAVLSMVFFIASGGASPYLLLQHMPWHGVLPMDLGFPCFLFVMGAAIPFAYGRRVAAGDRLGSMLCRAGRRSALLAAMGLVGGLGQAPGAGLRIPGVLQRIAACYLPAVVVQLKTSWRAQAAAAAAILAGYWALMSLVPVPGYGAGDLSPAGNLASYLDRRILGLHMANAVYDPDGLLTTLPSLATTLLGMLAGHWLRSRRGDPVKAAGLALSGLLGIGTALAWDLWFPMNKHLWTSSFVLFSAGVSCSVLSLCFWLIDVRGWRAWTRPFADLGVNALFVYCAANLLELVLESWQVAMPGGGTQNLRLYLSAVCFGDWLDPAASSLAYSLCNLALWLGVLEALRRRNMVITV
jgi:predicted acyltransferase